MFKKYALFICFSVTLLLENNRVIAINPDSALVVRKTTDFEVNGEGSAKNWSAASWFDITVQKSPDKALTTRAKILYSEKGVYFLFDCEDKKLTSTIMEDYAALYKEDVVEVFLWPDTGVPIYLEYEISPLNYELPILVPNINGKFQGWKPWFYDETNKIRHATSAHGGQKKSMGAVEGWKAEFFIPYSLMNPIVQAIPKSGTRWKGNFYRIDYDNGYTTWSWQKTSGSFHEYKKFGTLVFD